MAEFTPAQIEAVVTACRENLTAVADSLNQCFGTRHRLKLVQESAWSPDAESTEFAGPGLMITIGVGEQALAVLIPPTLPLPDWYLKPGDSQNARLQTLPMEWSINLLPADLEAERSTSVDVADMWEALKNCSPADGARMAELLVFSAEEESSAPAVESAAAESPADTKAEAESEASTEKPAETAPAEGEAAATPHAEAAEAATAPADGPAPICRLLMVWPVTKPLFEKPAGAAEPSAFGAGADEEEPSGSSGESSGAPTPMDEFRARARRILKLPVVVSVRLAEKRIETGQLLSITPGSLITFNKSCEELLDLYVNNRKYCRGEAVKIGEKFGIKINQVGVVDVREERILQ